MIATYQQSAHLGSNIWTFKFKGAEDLYYTAGQFIELSLELPETSKDKNKRWFTLSSSPTENYLSITTRLFGDSSSDYKKALSNLKLGQEVTVSQSMGDFVLPKNDALPLTFAAFGIGITPYRSMIKWLSDTEQMRNITLLHVVNDVKDLVFADLFRSYECNYIPVLSSSKDGLVEQVLDISRNTSQIYMSGPEQIVEDLRNQLIGYKYPERLLVGDYFPGYNKS